MTALAVIGILATPTSGAAGAATTVGTDSRAQERELRVSAPENYRGGDARDAANERGSRLHVIGAAGVTGSTLGRNPTGRGSNPRQPISIVTPSAVFVVYGERCRSARRAISHYRALTWGRQAARGGKLADRTPIVRGKTCRWARFAAEEWQARARAARRSLKRWSYDWNWRAWLPAKWVRVFHCETPTNGQYINWQHNSGTYEGGPGFYFGTWDQYKPKGAPERADLASPRQQYQAALNVHAAHGFGAWGCGGR